MSSQDRGRQLATHPPAELYSWYARHDGMPVGRVLVVTCKACGKVLQGGADLEE